MNTYQTNCAYCGFLLPQRGDETVAVSPRYCCYGCRILGEAHPKVSISRPASTTTAWWRVGLGAAIAGQTMVLGLALNLNQPAGALRLAFHAGLALSAAAAVAVLGGPLFRAGWECSCRRKAGIELLFIAGILGAFGASLYSTLTGRGAIYYEVVAVLVTVYTAGKLLTAHLRQGAVGAIADLRHAFSIVRVQGADGSWTERSVVEVVVGNRIKVLAAEPVPIDGVVWQGEAYVTETPLTGEPYPVICRIGDRVLAGSFCEDGELLITASCSGRERQLDETLAAVDRAQRSIVSTHAQVEADRIAQWFLPTVLGISTVTLVYWGLRGLWDEGIFHALSVILVACPCALGLVAPLSMWRALAALASRGIVVRDARALELLASVRTVVFDKTGTLSEAQQTLVDFVVLPGVDREYIKSMVAAVQRASVHPVARAFDGLVAQGTKAFAGEVRSLTAVPARGLEAVLGLGDGVAATLRLGERDWIVPHGELDINIKKPDLATVSGSGARQIYISLDGRPVGVAFVREKLRDSAFGAISGLRSMGCRLAVLTGDRADRAAALLGSPADLPIHAGLSAQEKCDWVVAAKQLGGVAFVGDGVNDAPAMSEASVGIALGSGAKLATESAGIVIASSDVSEAANLVAYARQLVSGIRHNLIFAALYNAVGMGLAASGRLHPVVASLLMFASSAVVSWRAVRSASLIHCRAPRVASPAMRWKFAIAAAFLVQLPLLIYLGQLRLGVALGMTILQILGMALVLRWKPEATTNGANFGRMSLAMFGVGNLGMLAGWFLDAGAGPVMVAGTCLCCQSHHYFDFGGRIPWMHLGMLVAGAVAMWPFISPMIRGWNRAVYLSLSGLGMVGGMSVGADAFLAAAGPMHPYQFVIAYVGMSLGMLLGMALGCALAEMICTERIRFRAQRAT